MAGMGPPPKDGDRLGRSKSELDEPLLTFAGASSAPPKLPKYREYHYRTKRWWDAWCDCPQAASFTQTDWNRLLMLAPLVEAYNRMTDVDALTELNPSNAIKILAEIRQNESLLGATHLDRLRGRIKIERDKNAGAENEDDPPEGVAILDEYRRALGA